MTKGTKAYISFITLCGLALLGYASYRYFLSLETVDIGLEIQQMICLIVLCVCCGSLPIVSFRKGSSRGLIRQLSAFWLLRLSRGPYAAMVIYFISSLFVVRKVKNKHQTIFNTPLYKTLFNTSNLMIAIFVPGILVFGDTGFRGRTASQCRASRRRRLPRSHSFSTVRSLWCFSSSPSG